MARKKHSNIPIFIPELACPHQCVFCNQRKISGTQTAPSLKEVRETIETYLESMNDGRTIEIAFFGGSFTGLPENEQKAYLGVAHEYVLSGKVQGIRLSTRPDYISSPILQMLKAHGVVAIELGAQSTHVEILQKSGRGHSREDIINAAKQIKSEGFELGLQMMIGLPGDSFEKSLQTAKDIIQLGADTTRIYPTVVVRETSLATLFENKQYTPLSMEQAIEWCSRLLPMFIDARIKVLRVGLHPSEDLVEGKELLAGPMHASFKEMVLSHIWKREIATKFSNKPKGNYTLTLSNKEVNYAIGYKGENRSYFEQEGYTLQFVQSPVKRKLFSFEVVSSEYEVKNKVAFCYF